MLSFTIVFEASSPKMTTDLYYIGVKIDHRTVHNENKRNSINYFVVVESHNENDAIKVGVNKMIKKDLDIYTVIDFWSDVICCMREEFSLKKPEEFNEDDTISIKCLAIIDKAIGCLEIIDKVNTSEIINEDDFIFLLIHFNALIVRKVVCNQVEVYY